MVHNVPNNARKQQEKRLSGSATLNPLRTILRSGTCLHDSQHELLPLIYLHRMVTKNAKKFWQVIRPKSSPNISISDDQDEIIPHTDCAKMFNIAFSSVFTTEYNASVPALHVPSMSTIDVRNCFFSERNFLYNLRI